MRAVHSPADDKIYANLLFGVQGTGGSSAIANSYEQYRTAGATARAMLVAAAAEEWGVPAAEITVDEGSHPPRRHRQGKRFRRACRQGRPADPAGRAEAQGRQGFRAHRQGSAEAGHVSPRATGKAVFTLDVLADNMLVAVVRHPDHFGATVKSFDDGEARKVAGVVDVRQVSQGVAVLAENTFAALRGRAALEVEWDLSKAEKRSSSELESDFAAKFPEQGHGGGEARRCRQGIRRGRHPDARGRDRLSVPGARADGAARCGLRPGRGWDRRHLQRGAVSRHGQDDGRQGAGPRSIEGARPHAAGRRQLRTPRAVRLALHAGGGRGLQGNRRLTPRQAYVDPRGRSARRLLPPDVCAQDARRGRCGRQDRGLGPGHRRPVDHGQGLDRTGQDLGRRRVGPALWHRQPPRRLAQRPAGHSAAVVAFGGPHPYRLCRRDLRRRVAQKAGKDPVEGRLAMLTDEPRHAGVLEEGRGDGRLGRQAVQTTAHAALPW